MYRNICAKYELEFPGPKWTISPKVVENDRARILWDLQIQTDKMMVAKHQGLKEVLEGCGM